ncbi:MAG: DUF3488 and transglutaminase-like domain-containing protein [Kangiellaceae bacterium]|jgi:transglutaminase-like putative cysteine protease|nr:DUF3488 and transglutaminase-like domain-containing protein [Kangiellaceae bacterium]
MLLLPEQQRIIQPLLKSRLAWVQLIVLLPFVTVFNPLLSAMVLIVPSWILLQHYRHKSSAVNRWLLVGFTLLCSAYIISSYGTFRGKDAGVALFAIMYSLKILEANKYRDLNLLLTLGYFILSMSFLFTQSPLAVFYMFFGYIVITHTIMLANATTQVMVDWKKSVKLILITTPLMIMLFVFFPRLANPLWKTNSLSSGTSGISDSMTPGDVADLKLSDDPAFRVKFSTASRELLASELYWRGIVFEDYDGLTWNRANIRDDVYFRKQGVSYTTDEDLINYSITIEPTKQKWLFSLDFTKDTEGRVLYGTDGTILSSRIIEQRSRYEVTSDLNAQLDTSITQRIRQLNTQLPDGFNPRSLIWAQQLFQTAATAQDYVRSLLQHINENEFFYTLAPPVMLEDMVDDFWFEQQRGFCEHYAGSFVFMLRAVGIPARVVTGYQGGQYNDIGDYYLVRQKDAHAWVEYWSEGVGWTRVDPTSAIDPSRIDDLLLSEMGQRGFLFDELPDADLIQSDFFDYAKQWLDSANTAWRDWILDFNQGSQSSLLSWLKLSNLPRGAIVTLFVTIFAVVVFILLKFLQSGKASYDNVAKAYRQLINRLAKRGIKHLPHEGAKTFHNRVVEQRPDWRNQLQPLFDDYLMLRYGFTATEQSANQEQMLANRFIKGVKHLSLPK